MCFNCYNQMGTLCLKDLETILMSHPRCPILSTKFLPQLLELGRGGGGLTEAHAGWHDEEHKVQVQHRLEHGPDEGKRRSGCQQRDLMSH